MRNFKPSVEQGTLRLAIVGTILSLVALFTPQALSVSFGYDVGYYPTRINVYVFAMTWIMPLWSPSVPMGGFWFFHMFLPLSFLRLAFIYQIYRRYRGFTTTPKTIRLGIMAELQFSVSMYLLNLFGAGVNLLPPIPIPLLALVAGAFLMIMPPPKEPLMWIEKEIPWWCLNEQIHYGILRIVKRARHKIMLHVNLCRIPIVEII